MARTQFTLTTSSLIRTRSVGSKPIYTTSGSPPVAQHTGKWHGDIATDVFKSAQFEVQVQGERIVRRTERPRAAPILHCRAQSSGMIIPSIHHEHYSRSYRNRSGNQDELRPTPTTSPRQPSGTHKSSESIAYPVVVGMHIHPLSMSTRSMPRTNTKRALDPSIHPASGSEAGSQDREVKHTSFRPSSESEKKAAIAISTGRLYRAPFQWRHHQRHYR